MESFALQPERLKQSLPALSDAVPPPAQEFGERELIVQLQAGDSQAYERVVRELGGRLFATALRMLKNEDDAREAVQDAFLSAFRNIQNFDEKAKLSTWLHRIVINASLMKLRTKRRKPSVSLDALTARPGEESSGEPAVASWRRGEDGSIDAPVEEEVRQRLRSEIDELPDEYRTVLMLRDIEELDTAETATVLGLSESAVKTRLHRARQALRDRLKGYFLEGVRDGGPAEGGASGATQEGA
jgi:RNA polymerase sigma-70 factor, ECF subfamily